MGRKPAGPRRAAAPGGRKGGWTSLSRLSARKSGRVCVCVFLLGKKKNGRENRFCRIHVGIGSRLRYRHEKVVYEPGCAWGSISLAARAEGSRRGGRAACLGRPRRRSGACAHFPPPCFSVWMFRLSAMGVHDKVIAGIKKRLLLHKRRPPASALAFRPLPASSQASSLLESPRRGPSSSLTSTGC